MNFKEIADNITDRDDLQEALKKAYDQGSLDERNRWWSDRGDEEGEQDLWEQATLIDMQLYEDESHNWGPEDDR